MYKKCSLKIRVINGEKCGRKEGIAEKALGKKEEKERSKNWNGNMFIHHTAQL